MAKKSLQHKTLELFQKIGDRVTPEQINKHSGGTGSYFSKHICILRSWGYTFDLEKDGRTILSYTLTGVPENDAEYRISKVELNRKRRAARRGPPKIKDKRKPKAKWVEKKSVDAVSAVSKDAKERNLEKMKRVLAEKKAREREILDVLEDEPTPTSYAIDADWDTTENIDIKELI